MRIPLRRFTTACNTGISEQPAWPIVVSGIADVRTYLDTERAVLLVSDAISAFQSYPSIPVFVDGALTERLKYILHMAVERPAPKTWTLDKRDRTMHEWVAYVAPPSFLDKLLTALCKINPYQDRKAAQALAIEYIMGGSSTKARSVYRSHHKYSNVAELLFGADGDTIRNALREYLADASALKDIAQRYGLMEFEIKYFPASRARQIADSAEKKGKGKQ